MGDLGDAFFDVGSVAICVCFPSRQMSDEEQKKKGVETTHLTSFCVLQTFDLFGKRLSSSVSKISRAF